MREETQVRTVALDLTVDVQPVTRPARVHDRQRPAKTSRWCSSQLASQPGERPPQRPRVRHVEQPPTRHAGAPRSLSLLGAVFPSANGTDDCATRRAAASRSAAREHRLPKSLGRSNSLAVSRRHARPQRHGAPVSVAVSSLTHYRCRTAWKHNLCLRRRERKSFSRVVLCACVLGPLDDEAAMVESRALGRFGPRSRDRGKTPRRHWIVAPYYREMRTLM